MQNTEKRLTYNRLRTTYLVLHQIAFIAFYRFTGLAYVDVKKLSYKNIGFGVDGEKWIFINRTKTDTRSNIPLLPIASTILEKYKDHPQVINEDKLFLSLVIKR